MAKHNSLNELFTATANAIRSKTGSTDPIVADDFPSAIENIEAGGWDGNVELYDHNASDSLAVGVGRRFFCGNSQVKSVKIRPCAGIEDSAFEHCKNLESVTLSANRSHGTTANKYDIGWQSFYCCEKLKSADLGGVNNIGVRAFAGCGELETAVFEYEVFSIGDGAFSDCNKLREICSSTNTIKLSEVSSETFSGCTSIEHIRLDVCETIWTKAFRGCTSLARVVIYNTNGGYIKSYAFYECPNLKTLILKTEGENYYNIDISALIGTGIVSEDGIPSGEGFVYVSGDAYEATAAPMIEQATALAGDAGTAEYIVRAILRKIEDYPEICGTT